MCYDEDDRGETARPARSQLRLRARNRKLTQGRGRDLPLSPRDFSSGYFFVDKTTVKTATATKTGTRSLKSRVKGGRRRRRRGVREAPVEEEEEERDGGACDGVSSRDAYGGDTHRIAGLSRDHPRPEPAEEPRLLHRWRFLDRRLRAPHVHAAHAAHPARRRQGKGIFPLFQGYAVSALPQDFTSFFFFFSFFSFFFFFFLPCYNVRARERGVTCQGISNFEIIRSFWLRNFVGISVNRGVCVKLVIN